MGFLVLPAPCKPATEAFPLELRAGGAVRGLRPRAPDGLPGGQPGVRPGSRAAACASARGLVPEQVFVLGRMGNAREALALIISRLADIPQVCATPRGS